MDIALVTCADEPGLDADDALLIPALATCGLDARAVVWNDEAMNWSIPQVSIIRSSWDYHLQRGAFLKWAEQVAQLHALWNPLPILRWNTHKAYLQDLEHKGIAIVPTVWLRQGTRADLTLILAERKWRKAVVKPAVSASAYGTMLVTEETVQQGREHLERFPASQDMMVQPFLKTVTSHCERSLVSIDGEITHAIRRVPELGFSVTGQDQLLVPEEDEIELAHRILKLVAEPVLYARVDLIRDEEEVLRLMELELVEPSLWLTLAPHALERFAAAIARMFRVTN